MKLINKQDRSVLNEGRSQGIGYGFCKLLDDSTLETIMPISACKDYLSDVVYSEHSGKEFSAYGLKTKKLGIFDSGFAYLAASVLKAGARSQSEYPGWKAEVKDFNENFPAIVNLTNEIESLFKIDVRTTGELIEDNCAYFKLPAFWVQTTFMISLWGLVARNGLKFQGGDPIAYLGSVDGSDSYNMRNALDKLKKLIKGPIPQEDWNRTDKFWHNYGIVDWKG